MPSGSQHRGHAGDMGRDGRAQSHGARFAGSVLMLFWSRDNTILLFLVAHPIILLFLVSLHVVLLFSFFSLLPFLGVLPLVCKCRERITLLYN